ncbi:phage tail tape measure protein [Aureimonas psammosilenae]|uniref:phage tail tape measure protein n=1 Tax=Aureimonas psammosilenae TaxID=2495496 RepID=UPI0012612EA6|nr:phage tail tape measure protein [Aureimonas psammosilenae]
MAKNFSVKVTIGGHLESSLGGAVRKAESQLSALGRHAQAANSRIASAMQAPMLAVRVAAPAALAFGGQKSIAVAADFQSALTGIQQKAGATAEQTARLGEEIKALATSGRLASGINEIASAYERGAASGLALDRLKDFAELSTKAADGFGMTAQDVGNFAAKLATGMKMTDKEIREVFDLTNSLADAGIADESGIVEYMDRIGASLKTLGLTKEQSLSLGSTLLNIGMATETAATGTGALAGKLLTVGQLGGEGKKTFEKYMGSTKKFAKLVDKDANGALLSMLDTIRKLDKADRMEFLTSFVGTEWADEMLRLAEATDEYRRNLELAGDQTRWFGSLDKNYTLKLDDFWSQWQIAKNGLEKLGIDLGNLSMPMVQSGLDAGLRVAEEIGTELKSFKATVDLSEFMAAKSAISDLGEAIRDTLDLGSEKTAIGVFFDRIAQAANTASAAINIVKDAGQALGLVAPDDDTAAQKQRRRDRLVDGVFDGPLGVAPKAIYDVATGRFGSDYYSRTTESQRRAIEQQAATRGVSVETVRAEIEAAARRRADKTGQRSRNPFPRNPFAPENLPPLAYPTTAPKDLSPKLLPVPTPRPAESVVEKMGRLTSAAVPNIVGPLETEGTKAVLTATDIGARIGQAVSVTAQPFIDVSSITNAIDRTNALATALRGLPNVSVAAPTTPAIAGARARGGPVSGGSTYLVGERGPELFTPGRSGGIVPNHRLSELSRRAEAMAAGSSSKPGSTTYHQGRQENHFHIHGAQDPGAVAREVEAVLRKMQSRQRGFLSD